MESEIITTCKRGHLRVSENQYEDGRCMVCIREQAKQYRRNHYKRVDHEPKQCPYCKKIFKPKTIKAVFCSKRCQENAYYKKNVEKENARNREKYRKARRIVLEHYGCYCHCPSCTVTHPNFLSLEHEHGGGNRHREQIKINIYTWIIRNGFPEGFTVLCFNCNCAKGFYGICPHEEMTQK